ncbi:MAG: hypothetical protein QOJ69_1529 [Actinomycetota bacterium]|nr:hypothetical protein [Actinomycetota bacterium]
MRVRPRPLLAAAVLVLALGTGCHVTLAAGVDVRQDGSGTVRAGLGVDDEALAEIGDLAAVLEVADLRQAGWEVTVPAKEKDGLTWVRASKGFDDAEEANTAAAELSGPDGPFREFRVTHTQTLLRTKTGFTGVVDLSPGLTGLSDADLAAKLGDYDPGLDVEGLRRRFGQDLAAALRVEVSARLPGKTTSNAPTLVDGRAVWAPAVGDRIDMTADAEARRLTPLLSFVGGALVVVVGLLTVVLWRRRRRRLRPV